MGYIRRDRPGSPRHGTWRQHVVTTLPRHEGPSSASHHGDESLAAADRPAASYPRIVVTMRPIAATPMEIVVTHPTTLRSRPLVRSPIAARSFETSITRTMSGVATRPLSTALRTS